MLILPEDEEYDNKLIILHYQFQSISSQKETQFLLFNSFTAHVRQKNVHHQNRLSASAQNSFHVNTQYLSNYPVVVGDAVFDLSQIFSIKHCCCLT